MTIHIYVYLKGDLICVLRGSESALASPYLRLLIVLRYMYVTLYRDAVLYL